MRGTLLPVLVYAIQRAIWRFNGLFDRGSLPSLIANTGIVIFVGPNGSGKSLAAVEAALDVLDGETWRCLAVDHGHNLPFREHQSSCEVCEARTIDRPRRCGRGTVYDRLCLYGLVDCHVRKCPRCERRPGELGGRCARGLAILAACGTGERLVYSTVPLLAADGTPHRLYRPCLDYRQLVTIEHADVLFDEVAGVSDSSDSSAVPSLLVRWLQQLRKRDVRLRVTTPAYKRCSMPIRQVAQLVVDARSFFPEPGGTGSRWRSRRAMIYRAYDAFTFDEFTMAASSQAREGKGRLKVTARRAFWRPGSRAESGYDTLAQVIALADVTETGMCTACGGSRSRPRCACSHDLDLEQPHEVKETVQSGGGRVRKAVPIALESVPAKAG